MQVPQGLVSVLKTTSVQRDVFVLQSSIRLLSKITFDANVKGSWWKVNGYIPDQLVLNVETQAKSHFNCQPYVILI